VPKENEVVVRVKAFGINRMDIIQRNGLYTPPLGASSTLGLEYSGTIASLGSDAGDGWKIGDSVFGLAYGGAYAEYVAVNVKSLIRKPASLTDVEACSLPQTWMTAAQALHMVLNVDKGKTCLWHAGASGVGIAGIQLARLAGANAVYATAGTDEKCDYITSRIGADAAFNYKTQDWVEEIKRATGNLGVDYIFDFIGQDYFQKNLEVAAQGGSIAILAFLSGSKIPDGDVSKLLYKHLTVKGSSLRGRDLAYQSQLRDRLESYMPAFEKGDLRIIVDKVFPWEEIVGAHEYMEAANNTGKIVCTVS
jgi:putative PIG3 family NAD(P)H quinone oxidoreductase